MTSEQSQEATGWLVGDINGDVHLREGIFDTIEACRQHIQERLDGEQQREYGMDSMFEPTGVPKPKDALQEVLRHSERLDLKWNGPQRAAADEWLQATSAATEALSSEGGDHTSALGAVIAAAKKVRDARPTPADPLGSERELNTALAIGETSVHIERTQREREPTDEPEREGRRAIQPGAINETAQVDPSATIADDVEIGPRTIIAPEATVGPGCRLGPDVRVERGAQIGNGTRIDVYGRIGENARIGAGCELNDGTCVGKGATLGDRVVVRSDLRNGVDSYIGAGAQVGADTKISYGCAIRQHARVGSGCELGPETIVEHGAVVADETKLPAGSHVHNLKADKPIRPGGDPTVTSPPPRPSAPAQENAAATRDRRGR